MMIARAMLGVQVHGHEVRGEGVDAETRCAHYDSALDVVAIKFDCCGTYYPCFRCHDAVTEHDADRWPAARRDEPAVLCGACGAELTVETYVGVDACPECDAAFNPGCADHYQRYFEAAEADSR
ncbi:Uncharacterized protein, contains Zn-finger domain of CHY type [Natronoarchaeum philippinense]|uniref:Uncharacterized protein, contains Zn-finger domain of CHY type n=1 Tax=Natronoarchaeum philippinense TaxID=558529 RepID=A0A285P3K8_NATPI|nr:Uncharacterized protein, contains Zn-finger domain of CHY type [Natronoarchaeum philippinense]